MACRKFSKRMARVMLPVRHRKKKPRRVHVNKYHHLVPNIRMFYDAFNKRFRELLLIGEPGVMFDRGTIVMYHGRRYRLTESIIISTEGFVMGKFKMCSKSYE